MHVIVKLKIGREPEVKGIKGENICIVPGFYSKPKKDNAFETMWISVFCGKYFFEHATKLAKGMRIIVSGRMEQRTYINKEGESKVSFTIYPDLLERIADHEHTFDNPQPEKSIESLSLGLDPIFEDIPF